MRLSVYGVSLVLVATGFLAPWWPIAAVGVAVAAVGGAPLVALALGLVLDVAWGVPHLPVPYVYFPFTTGALVLVLLQRTLGRYFLDRSAPMV